MDKWSALFLLKGSSIAVLATFSLASEALVNMSPKAALWLRGFPILVGFSGSYVFLKHEYYFCAGLFLISGFLSFASRLWIREDWNPGQRAIANLTPMVSFVITAGLLHILL